MVARHGSRHAAGMRRVWWHVMAASTRCACGVHAAGMSAHDGGHAACMSEQHHDSTYAAGRLRAWHYPMTTSMQCTCQHMRGMCASFPGRTPRRHARGGRSGMLAASLAASLAARPGMRTWRACHAWLEASAICMMPRYARLTSRPCRPRLHRSSRTAAGSPRARGCLQGVAPASP
eukprot:366187-Chlamydomonas_euryale.AAC.6